MNDIQSALNHVKQYLENDYIVEDSQNGDGGRYELHLLYVGNDKNKISTGCILHTSHNGIKELYRLIDINKDYFNGIYKYNKVFELFNKFAENERSFVDKFLVDKPYNENFIPEELKKLGVKA